MQHMKVHKSKIINTLKNHKDTYNSLYKVSLENYRKKSADLVEEKLEFYQAVLESENEDVENYLKSIAECEKLLKEAKKKIIGRKEKFDEEHSKEVKRQKDFLNVLKDPEVKTENIDFSMSPIDKPTDYSDDYDNAQFMIKHAADEIIDLNKSEIDTFILNRWSWKTGFLNSLENIAEFKRKHSSDLKYQDWSIHNTDLNLSFSIKNIYYTNYDNPDKIVLNSFNSSGTYITTGATRAKKQKGVQGSQGSQGPRGIVGTGGSYNSSDVEQTSAVYTVNLAEDYSDEVKGLIDKFKSNPFD